MSFAPLLGLNPYVFYSGTTAADTAVPFTVRLGGHTYGIDLRNYKRSAVASLREAVVNTGQVDDSLYNTDGAWWRYKHDWSHGAGQTILDLGNERDPRRFNTSVGIDPWTEGQLTLLPSTSRTNDTVTGAGIDLAVTESHIYAADGSAVYRSDSTLVSWSQITGLSGTVKGITSDGITCYITTSVDTYKTAVGSTAASALGGTAIPGSDVWFAGNYLFQSLNNVLYTVTSAGVRTAVATHFQASFKWTSVFAVGSKVYAGGYAGLRSEVFGFTVSSTGTLVQGAEVVSFSVGELLETAISHVGIVIFGTNKGVRIATPGADGSLSYGPLIDTPGPVVSAQAEGQYVWFSWPTLESGKTGAGRLDLSAFPRPLQPAFATDVYVEQNSLCCAVARFAGRTFLGVPSHGIYVSSTTNYVTSGYLTSGNVYFGTVEPKSVTDLQAVFAKLGANQGVTMKVYDEEDNLINEAGTTLANSTRIVVQLDGEQADEFRVRVELTGPGSSTPRFEYWRLRAFPVVPPVEQFIVPLLLYGNVVVNDAQGQIMSLDVDEELIFLSELWESKRPISYVEGSTVRRVRLDAYEFSSESWADNHAGFEGTMVVKLITL
jgi:hypothetical protein